MITKILIGCSVTLFSVIIGLIIKMINSNKSLKEDKVETKMRDLIYQVKTLSTKVDTYQDSIKTQLSEITLDMTKEFGGLKLYISEEYMTKDECEKVEARLSKEIEDRLNGKK